jgi:Sigma-70 region 2
MGPLKLTGQGWRTILPGMPPAAFAPYASTACASGYTAPTWGRRCPSSTRRASSISEDAVQETYARWYAQTPDQRDAIASPGAWLTTVTSRICLDQLGSARARRERYVGQWIPEPLPEPAEWIGSHPGAPALTILERTVNGQPGLIAQQDGTTVTVFAFGITGDHVTRIWAIRNPDMLRPWATG